MGWWREFKDVLYIAFIDSAYTPEPMRKPIPYKPGMTKEEKKQVLVEEKKACKEYAENVESAGAWAETGIVTLVQVPEAIITCGVSLIPGCSLVEWGADEVLGGYKQAPVRSLWKVALPGDTPIIGDNHYSAWTCLGDKYGTPMDHHDKGKLTGIANVWEHREALWNYLTGSEPPPGAAPGPAASADKGSRTTAAPDKPMHGSGIGKLFGIGSLIGAALGALGFLFGPAVGLALTAVGGLVGQTVMNMVTKSDEGPAASSQTNQRPAPAAAETTVTTLVSPNVPYMALQPGRPQPARSI